MAPRSQAFRSILRTSTSTLRASSTTAPTQFQGPLSFTQFQRHSPTRSRSPSPPPPYQSRNISLLASPNQWTRFNTPYTLSSVRTFASTSRIQWPNETPEGATTDPQAAKHIEEAIEEIQELYGTARDEFEIAAEETEKNTTYAPDDRAAAREELDKLLEFYNGIVEGQDRAVAEEVKRRVGQRIRELEQAVIAMEEMAAHGD